MNYRPEIDGLRALAVVIVVLFHAELLPTGGFVGVDVFFVISGYLITSLILNDIQADRFSFVVFYERRARRILPALFVVSIFSVLFAWLWLSPADLLGFADSLIAVPLYISNIYFWLQVDYFDSAAELKPLLHTWSLAVEEQFYLIFPLMLLVVWRFQRHLLLKFIASITCISFGLSVWGAQSFPAAAYFLPHTRTWELMIGSLCAIIIFRKFEILSLPQWMDAVGLALILGSAFFFDKTTPFPSFYALVPTLGTALVILFCCPGSSLHRLLSLKPIVNIGLISYSLYLWHQPVLAFARHRLSSDLGLVLGLMLILLSFLLAWLSWLWFEWPFRQGEKISTKALWFFAGIGSLGLVSLGLALKLDDGHAGRMTANGQSFKQLHNRIRTNHGLHRNCARGYSEFSECKTSDAANTLVWGDSYAMHIIPALNVELSGSGVVQQTKSACAPLIGVSQWPKVWSKSDVESCMSYNDAVMDWLESQPQIDVVVLASNWNIVRQRLRDRDLREHENVDGEFAIDNLLDLVGKIRSLGKFPILVNTTPSSGFDLGRCVINAIRFGASTERCDFPVESNRRTVIKDKVSSLAGQVPVFSYEPWICPKKVCQASVDGTLIYRDKGHLSVEGAEWLGRNANLLNRLREMAKR